jgi:hypothetical protein
MNRGKMFHHPARPLVIISLFERVAMDLVLGLPENEEKYVEILVITEYLS